MYNVGDRIVYPMHGAGIIESIEEKIILGNKKDYYVLGLPLGDMKVMIPVDSLSEVGIRDVIGIKEFEKVMEVLGTNDNYINNNWNKRYRENMVKIKSGDIYDVAAVVRTLMLRDKEKGLSTGERKMLNSARQILLSELILARNSTLEDIDAMINNILDAAI